MKKLILTLAFATMGFVGTYAIKANPSPITIIQQSDGSQITVMQHGDEDASWYTTMDGVLLVQVGANYYVAQVEADGSLKATPQLAHEAGKRSLTEQKVVAQQDKTKFYDNAEEMMAEGKANGGIGTYAPPYLTHMGKPKVLVVLVEFPDCKFQARDNDAKNIFNYVLNGRKDNSIPVPSAYTEHYFKSKSYSGVGQYFEDMSQGLFIPQFDVVGPVEVSKSYTYYGADNTRKKDVNLTEMAIEACEKVKDQVDFSLYDNDGDHVVDLIYFIYAGYGQHESGNPAETIWAKCVTPLSPIATYNGYSIQRYGVNNEINGTVKLNASLEHPYLNGIGVFVHEFSHALGFPDLYAITPTNGESVDNQAMENWDIMDGGAYLNRSYYPAPYSPWELESTQWVAPTSTLNTAQQVSLPAMTATQLPYLKIEGDNGEYLLLQNIQNEGWWKAMPTHGLLIQRIDYPYNQVNIGDRPNQRELGKPAITIVPADGELISSYYPYYTEYQNIYKLYQDAQKKWASMEKGEEKDKLEQQCKDYYNQLVALRDKYNNSYLGDTYPGSGNVTEIKSIQLNGSVLNKPIYNIKEDGGVITFDFLEDFTSGINHPTIDQDANEDGRIFTLDGRYLGTDASHLSKGVYIIGKKKVIIK